MVFNPFNVTLQRIRAEYIEMPGMVLKPHQIERLCGVDPLLCRLALETLVRARFLRMRADGAYVRVTDEPRDARVLAEATPPRSVSPRSR